MARLAAFLRMGDEPILARTAPRPAYQTPAATAIAIAVTAIFSPARLGGGGASTLQPSSSFGAAATISVLIAVRAGRFAWRTDAWRTSAGLGCSAKPEAKPETRRRSEIMVPNISRDLARPVRALVAARRNINEPVRAALFCGDFVCPASR